MGLNTMTMVLSWIVQFRGKLDPTKKRKINVSKYPNIQLHVSKNMQVTCEALRGSRVHSSLYKQLCAPSALQVM